MSRSGGLPAPGPAAEPGPGRGGTVLVIDDDVTVRCVARRVLARRGYEVLVAGDGREGLAPFRRKVARVALVLVDLAMPGMDGASTCCELRRSDPRLRIVPLSGYSEHDIAPMFAGKGLAGFLQKPLEASELLEAVGRALERPGG